MSARRMFEHRHTGIFENALLMHERMSANSEGLSKKNSNTFLNIIHANNTVTAPEYKTDVIE
jgi:hypothetical protein